MSRLFIKNIPKNLTEVELKKTFEKMGFKYFELERWQMLESNLGMDKIEDLLT